MMRMADLLQIKSVNPLANSDPPAMSAGKNATKSQLTLTHIRDGLIDVKVRDTNGTVKVSQLMNIEKTAMADSDPTH